MLAGGRALLMQLAHPVVAAGVAEHSNFRQRPLHRLLHTLDLHFTLTFGERRKAFAVAQTINRVHHGIRGAGYSAEDPTALFWVQATLIDSTLEAYEAFVRPLRAIERDDYLREAPTFGRLLGVPAALYPSDFAGFKRYMEGMLSGSELRVDARARELAADVLSPGVRGVPDVAWAPLRALTAGLLPKTLREAYGLPWGRPQRAILASARWSLPRLIPVLPTAIRIVPHARRNSGGVPPVSPRGQDTTVSGSRVHPKHLKEK